MKKEKGTILRFKKIIAAYVLVALLAPVLANDKPLYLSADGNNYFPAFSSNAYIELIENGTTVKRRMNSIDWSTVNASVVIFAPIRWSPETSDLLNVYASPFSEQQIVRHGETIPLPVFERHLLGTGRLGNDTLSGLIHGARNSILIGLFSTIIALLLGILLGGIAGYFGDYSIKISRQKLIAALLLIVPAWFYGFYLRSNIITIAFNESNLSGMFQLIFGFIIFSGIIALPFIIHTKIFNSNKILIPVDSIISRFIEIFISLPRLILILTVAAIVRPSVGMVILLIGLTSWTEIARLVRSQLLQLKQQNYIEAARATGMSTYRLISVHIMPNIKNQLQSIGVFGVAAAILTESGLSFLGIGVPADTTTWGQIMFEARQHYVAWWLVLFSGLAISGLLYSLFAISLNTQKANTEWVREK